MALDPAHLSRLVRGAAILALLTALACGGGDEGTQTGSNPLPEKGTRTIPMPAGEDGEATGQALLATGEIPEGFPSDIEIPATSEPVNAIIIPEQGGLATFKSSDSRESVFAHFKKAMADQGWNVVTEEDARRHLVKGTKPGRAASVTISSADGGVEYAVTFEGKL